jgi:hypothetical protein
MYIVTVIRERAADPWLLGNRLVGVIGLTSELTVSIRGTGIPEPSWMENKTHGKGKREAINYLLYENICHLL